MDCEALTKACEDYKNEEDRAGFYDIALEIADIYPLQASIVILAGWNNSRFRFIASDGQNLNNFQRAMEVCKPLFEKLKGKDFKTTNFDEISDIVMEIYKALSEVKGVEYTGASKVMHLLNRELFVMWNRDARKEYECENADGQDYLKFLKKMQEMFKDIDWRMPSKTLTKAVDEYNQVTITIPKMKRRRAKAKGQNTYGESE